MAYNTTAALDQVDQTKLEHEVQVNQLLNALSEASLFGINQRLSNGLILTLYGGVFPLVGGTLIAIPTTILKLTPSTTNYIYVNSSGVITQTTSAPAGWPTLIAGALALYQLTVGTDSVTSGTSYVLGCGTPGSTGPVGSTGPAGIEIYQQRKRWYSVYGTLVSTADSLGMDITSVNGYSGRALGTTYLGETLSRASTGTTNVTGTVGALYGPRNLLWIGNASGLGGFDVFLRWLMDPTFTNNTQRSFVGMIDITPGVPGAVEPDTLVNLFGVCAKTGDANFSSINNDGSGTATLTGLGSNFPARATSNTYEMRFTCPANGSAISWTLTCADTGNTTSGTFSSNIPANTQFLSWMFWVETGLNSTVSIEPLEIVLTSRF